MTKTMTQAIIDCFLSDSTVTNKEVANKLGVTTGYVSVIKCNARKTGRLPKKSESILNKVIVQDELPVQVLRRSAKIGQVMLSARAFIQDCGSLFDAVAFLSELDKVISVAKS